MIQYMDLVRGKYNDIDNSRAIECIGVDGKQQVCICGIVVKRKKLLRDDIVNGIEQVCAGLDIRIISDCQLIEDMFGEQYYSFGLHFMDLNNIGYNVIKQGLVD